MGSLGSRGGGGGGSAGGSRAAAAAPASEGSVDVAAVLREREEARARLKEKFGEGGLAGQSVGYTPPGWTPGGGSSNSGGSLTEDILGAELVAK